MVSLGLALASTALPPCLLYLPTLTRCVPRFPPIFGTSHLLRLIMVARLCYLSLM